MDVVIRDKKNEKTPSVINYTLDRRYLLVILDPTFNERINH